MNNDKSLSEILDDAEIFTDGDWIESKDQDKEGSVRLTQLADVGDGYWVDKSARFLTEEKAVKLRCTILKKGDLLIARMPDPLGRCCIFPGDRMQCVTVVDVCIVRPNSERVFGRYLMHAINAPIGRRGIAKHITGTTRQRISRRNLGKVEIPLPPLAEQKRIAGILDAADALRAKRKQALAHLDDLLQSTFLTLFGDPVTNPMGWETVSFAEIGKFVSGATPSKEREDFWDGGVPWVSPKDMKRDFIGESIDTISPLALEKTNIKLIESGALLVVVRGMILAHSFPVAINTKSITINQDMKAIRPSPSLLPLYLLRCLKAQKRQILNLISDAGHGTKKFNRESMERLPIPLPPLPLQQRFTAIVESIEAQKSRHRAHLAELDTLFASLQSRAFSGEL